MESKTFKEWWREESCNHTFDYPSESAELVWDYKQEEIERLEKEIYVLKYRLACYENDV